MQRSCASCGGSLEGLAPQARYCRGADCRRKRERGRQQESRHGTVVDLVPPTETSAAVSAATLATLEEHGVTATPSGAAALALAAKLDIGQDSGSAMAALARELRSTIDDALRSSSIRTDVVDELSARRRARVAGA